MVKIKVGDYIGKNRKILQIFREGINFNPEGLSPKVWFRSIEKKKVKAYSSRKSDFYNRYQFKYQYL